MKTCRFLSLVPARPALAGFPALPACRGLPGFPGLAAEEVAGHFLEGAAKPASLREVTEPSLEGVTGHSLP
ncbi:hypothetical protein GCM10018952_10440 [Streptosporangium vulgare]